MMKFPIKFDVEATASSGMGSGWTAQADALPPIPSAIPVEFMGQGGGYSPEDLFAIALLNCLIATYKVYCEKSKISFQQIKAKASLTVDKLPDHGGLGMTQIEVTLNVEGASDPTQARQVLENAIKDCAVSNSIKSGKTFQIHIS